jgi:hypothetical protein
MSQDRTIQPRNYFLNEQHELSREERATGGSVLKLAPINWSKKQTAIQTSIADVEAKLKRSKDPARKHRYYVVVDAEPTIIKASDSKNKPAQYAEDVDYAGPQHSRAISRLGLDVLDVTKDGNAVVHVTPDGFDKLTSLVPRLSSLGKLDQSRWAMVKGFSFIPASKRIDNAWLRALPDAKPSDAVVELQPMLRRLEADEVIRAISELTRNDDERIRSAGTDFSGRMWIRAMFRPKTLERIAEFFFSVQSIHQPLRTAIALASKKEAVRAKAPPPKRTPVPPRPISDLPVVGVVDGGVPDDHVVLAAFLRGTFQHPDCHPGWLGPHGSLVTSRVVFGDPDYHDGLESLPTPGARYLDVRVAATAWEVDDKSVVSAIEQCVNAYPDVRVFNLSFSDRTPLAKIEEVERREKLRITQDLDNLVFARDIIVILAAGNSHPGQIPTSPYPSNYQDKDWELGHWACAFNGLTCGAFVGRASPGGLARQVGAPSPFCKVGPGLHGSPVPDFSAPGGDVSSGYNEAPGLGVFGCNQTGDWEDHSGTSFASPLLARECARALDALKNVCPRGARPYGATVKAFLALTAAPPSLPPQYAELAARTLGRGEGRADPLLKPSGSTAAFVWQGVLESSKDLARITIPVPAKWIAEAVEPVVDVVVAWDTPVNAALTNVYACRNVIARMRPSPDARAVNPKRSSAATDGYPLYSRRYDLKKIVERLENDGEQPDDLWLLEVHYEQIAEYCPGLDFTPEQRVGISFALRDIGEQGVSPHSAVQALPISATMVRLSEGSIPVRAPVVVTAR